MLIHLEQMLFASLVLQIGPSEILCRSNHKMGVKVQDSAKTFVNSNVSIVIVELYNKKIIASSSPYSNPDEHDLRPDIQHMMRNPRLAICRPTKLGSQDYRTTERRCIKVNISIINAK